MKIKEYRPVATMHRHSARPPISILGHACTRTSALLGAPNTGKSSLFSILTGRKRMVANWPGVTVDVEIGVVARGNEKVCILDLPGTYGLVPTSPEEELALKIALEIKPSTLMVVVDSVNPESSLPLLLQALEAFPGRIIIVITKASLAHSQGVHLDAEKLSHLTRAPVVVTSVLEGLGTDELERKVIEGDSGGEFKVDYGVLEPLIEKLAGNELVREAAQELSVNPRWLVVQVLISEKVTEELLKQQGKSDVLNLLSSARREALKTLGIDPRVHVASRRLKAAEELARQVIVRRKPAETTWQRVADAFMHPVVGPIASIGGLIVIFTLVFAINTGFPLNILFEKAGWENASAFIEEYNINSVLTRLFEKIGERVEERIGGLAGSLLAHGVFGGVGFVLSFLPLIMMMFLALGVLEDSGLAARMAVSLHPLLERFGLTGRSVFPLVMGFGCNVPAVMTMKSLGLEERMRAVFAAPFVPCQARLAVMFALSTVIVGVPLLQALAVASTYIVALIVALLTAFLAGLIMSSGRKGEIVLPFVMEIPEVHAPHWKVVWWYVRDNTMHFIRKAGTIVFLLAVITWALLSIGPRGLAESPSESYGWMLGSLAGKVLEPLGVQGDAATVLGIALLNGLVAKEGVLAAIAVSTSMSENEVTTALTELGIEGSSAFAFMLLITLYFPCIATLSSMIVVTKKPKMILLFAVYSLVVALLVSYAAAGLIAFLAGGE